MEINTLPAVLLSPVEDTSVAYELHDHQQPVDFTLTINGEGWRAEALLENCRGVAWRGPVTLDAQGGISVTIPQVVGASLRTCKRIDATFQVRFFAPVPDFNMVWRAPASVLEVTP